jgi:arabinofuranan 3-O-arabinosyltransferase
MSCLFIRNRPGRLLDAVGSSVPIEGLAEVNSGEERGTQRERWATMAVCVGLGVMVLLQAPGRVVADNKLDLYTDPADMMRRATGMWDGRIGLGYVPNQQWGYLFPTGPLFWLGRNLGVPTWLVQRAWLAALLIAAFLGAQRIARVLHVGTAAPRLIAATVYALSPAMLIHLAQTSISIPSAMAVLPWIAIPLVKVQRKGSVPLAALASAVAYTFAGSVNFTTAFIAVIFPALFLVLRSRGSARRSLMRWWVVALGAASIAPVVGLLLLRRYGFDFTRVTEQAADTTATVSVTDAVRGTSDWLSYFEFGRPWSPAGQQFVHSIPVILAVGLIAALGVAGLARADLPERRWLSFTFGIGVVGQASAFTGLWGAPFATRFQTALNGPLVAFRNLSKFAPLVALPLALGLAHMLGAITRRWVRSLTLVGSAVALVAAMLPVATGRIFPDGAFTAVPGYWHEAADFLAREPLARTLMTPSTPFGEYTWGRPLDEPLQSIGRAPWVVRELFPAGGSDQATRLLDRIDAALSLGEPVPGLAAVLQRSGIRYVLLRADVDRTRSGSAEPAVIAAVLEGMANVTHLRSFGPVVGSGLTADRLVPRRVALLHAIELYEVAGTPSLVTTTSTDAVQLIGGLESMLNPDLAAFINNRPVVVDGDGGDALPPRSVVAADGLRLRDKNFGDARGALSSSYTLGVNELPAGSGGFAPLDLTGPEESISIAGDDGAKIIASSSLGKLIRLPEAQPYSAFDNDLATAWMPNATPPDSPAEWVQAIFPIPRNVAGTSVRLLLDAPWRPTIAAVRVVTDVGSAKTTLSRTSVGQTLEVPSGDTSFIRIEILKVDGVPGGTSQVGISELAVPGLTVRRPLIVPNAPAASTASLFFERSQAPLLNPSRWSEEATLDRLFTTSNAADYDVTATANLRQPTTAIEMSSLIGDGAVQATATSVWFGRSSLGANSAIDGDPQTSWVAGPYDAAPIITVRWDQPQTITGLRVLSAGTPGNVPTEVIVTAPNEYPQRVVLINASAPLDLVRTKQVTVEVVASTPSFGTQSVVTPPAITIAELSFDGTDARFDSTSKPTLACGIGPVLRIDGVEIATRPVGTAGEILSGGRVPLEICGSARASLGSGLHRLDGTDGGSFALASVALTGPDARSNPRITVDRSASVVQWTNGVRELHVAAGPAIVVSIAENFNAGWSATFAGSDVRSVRLDGWHQGWVLPAGEAGELRLTYGPSKTMHVALLAWVLGFAAFGLVAWQFARRRPARLQTGGERQFGPWLSDLVAAVGLFAMGGVAVFAVLILRRLRRDPLVLSVIAGASFGLAIIVAAIGHTAVQGSTSGAFSGLAQACSLVAVASVLVAHPAAPTVRRRRFRDQADLKNQRNETQ